MIYLDDLLKADDFGLAVNEIAKDFREKYSFPDIHQLGIVVPDVETAAAKLEEKGIGPFFIASSWLKLWREHGKAKSFHGKVGIGYHKGFEFELLEPGTGSAFYQSCVDPQCRMVVQHLGFRSSDVDAQARSLENTGCATWVRGKIKSFPLVTDFAYMDTRDQAGIILEFIVRLKFQKRSELKFVSRTIPQSGGCNTPQLAAEFVSKACFGVSYP